MFCFAACGLAGCIRDDAPVAPNVPGDNAIRLGISGIEQLKTRASVADEATESRVDRLDVLIFDTDGKKAHYERVAGSQQDKGQITLSKRRNEFTPGAEYWVYLIANSTLSETEDFGKIATLTDLRAKVQQDELIHVTGDGRTSGAPETFLMEGVAYPKNETEPSAPGRVVLNDGNMSENTELLVTLRRAAAKIEVVIKKGDKITFADQTHAAEGNNAAGYYINNMPYTTRLVPPTNETYLPEVVTTGRYNGPYFSWGDNPGAEVYPEQVRIKTYVYSHDWSRQSAFESEPYLVVNLPLWNHPDQPDVEGGSTYDPTQDPDSDAKYEQSNYYQIPICNPAQKRLDRNHIYRITVTVNAVGASNPTQAVDLEASYTVIPWETMTIGVGDDSSRPNYLMVNTDEMAMYNIDEDNNTLEFASSSKVTVTVVEAWYYDKNDDERYLNKNSKPFTDIHATPDPDLSGHIKIDSPLPTNNAPRYIKLKVTNEEGTERYITVVQYPLEYITNVHGWYSYRDDFNGGKTNWEYLDGNRAEVVESQTYGRNNRFTAAQRKTNSSNETFKFYSKVYKPETKSIYRYTWQEIGPNNNTYRYQRSAPDAESSNPNNRMYHVRITVSSGDYTLGRPRITNEITDGSAENAKIVSPSFLIASQLGTTPTTSSKSTAETHCRNYVEVHKVLDENGKEVMENGYPKVVKYDQWRLPTHSEVEIILRFQKVPDSAIDVVMSGNNYWSASGLVNKETPNGNPSSTSGNIRCVHDAYGDEN